MSLKPATRAFIEKVSVITIIYVVISLAQTSYDQVVINSEWSLGPTNEFDPHFSWIIPIIVGLIAGLVGGSALVFIYERIYRTKSFTYSLGATLIMFTGIFLAIIITINVIMSFAEMTPETGFTKTFKESMVNVLKPYVIANFIFWGLIVLLTVFFLQINDKFGPGILAKFIAGKYHQPRQEERLFMFLDMRSSTTIAEQLGTRRYFNLLQDVFNEITDPIIANRGEIYQYVGDEIIVSWKLEKPEISNHAVYCFLDIKLKLTNLSASFESKYGIIPEFKAGVHHGLVTAGEIGSIKKDIVYSGDVLNTAARIQGECNKYGVDLLISSSTKALTELSDFVFNSLGEIELRGKSERVGIYSIEPA